MKLSLHNLRTNEFESELEWDPDTGSLEGDLAARVLDIIEVIVADGSVGIHPHPADFPVDDPLRSREQMAAVLGTRWRCPELAADYPKVVDNTPDWPGVVN